MAKTKVKAETEPGANGTPQAKGETTALPCYALSLTVENVRCFGPKQELKLTDKNGRPAQWTIILGENGTGKTALLQSLAGFQQTRIKVLNSKKDFVIPRALKGFTERLIRSRKIESYFSQGYVRENQSEASCQLRYVPCTGFHTSDTTKEGNATWAINTDGQWKSESSLAGSIEYFAYGAGRRLGIVSLGNDFADDPAGTLFDENSVLRNAEEWLLQLDYSASKKSVVQDKQEIRLKQVKQLLITILPDIEHIRFDAGSGPYPKPRVEFKTFSGWVPLRRLGYGYQTLIALVLDFVSRIVERYPHSPDPFKESAIVLIDEIDLHLHPLWQRKLIADLTKHFPNTQFIATAHSPLVVQAAENANIAVLRRNGDHVEIINDPEEIRGWRIDQILTSDLFGLESARSPEVEALFKRKQELLSKTKQSPRDKAELRELQAKIDKLPVGDSAQSAKEMETIREALDVLKDHMPK